MKTRKNPKVLRGWVRIGDGGFGPTFFLDKSDALDVRNPFGRHKVARAVLVTEADYNRMVREARKLRR